MAINHVRPQQQNCNIKNANSATLNESAATKLRKGSAQQAPACDAVIPFAQDLRRRLGGGGLSGVLYMLACTGDEIGKKMHLLGDDEGI